MQKKYNVALEEGGRAWFLKGSAKMCDVTSVSYYLASNWVTGE